MQFLYIFVVQFLYIYLFDNAISVHIGFRYYESLSDTDSNNTPRSLSQYRGDYWNIGSRGGPGTPVHPLATTPKAIMTCSTVKLA